MSEPYAAFVKLRIDRPKLVRWLNAPIASPTRWEDWRKMGGQYYSEGGVKELSDYSDSEMLHCLAECDARLSGCRDNRSALRAIMETANPPELKRASYRADTREFIAGSLTYAENLAEFIFFYSVVRSVEIFLGEGDDGIAAIHDFLQELATDSAMRLGPGARSEFMHGTDMDNAGGAFQEIADQMLSGDRPPAPIDELDSLR